MRLATWNVRAGGGRRIDQIVQRVLDVRPDVLVLTEIRPRTGYRLIEQLVAAGYHASVGAAGDLGGQHVLNHTGVFSLHLLEPCVVTPVPQSVHRWVPVRIPALNLTVLGVHVPNQSERWNKVDFWTIVEAFARAHTSGRAVIIGDLNTALDEDCEGDPIREAVYLKRLVALGWVDAWRQCNPGSREFSWYSHRANGFLLDYCYVSPSLAPLVRGGELRHDVREQGLSDHSMLVVEFDFAGCHCVE